MALEKTSDYDIFDIDWSLLSDEDKQNIIFEHIKLVEISRRAVRVGGAANSNVRSLLFSMLLALVLGLQDIDNKTIVLSILGFLFIKSTITKFAEFGAHLMLENKRKDLSDYIHRKIKRGKSA